MIKESFKITVLPELRDYLVKLTSEEFNNLELSILAEGCRDNLIFWEKEDGECILIDGHNRYKICTRHNIPYHYLKIKFSELDEVKLWMIDNQLGRRNLNPDQLSYYRGLKYLNIRKKKGGYQNVKSKGQNELSATEMLAEQFKVSESTIKRDSKFAEGIDIIGKSNLKLKMQILSGEIKIKKSDVQILTEFTDPNIVIKNEADLLNKAKILKDVILDEVEQGIKKMEVDRDTIPMIKSNFPEPLFIERNDRLIKIKGMILAAINKAINNRNGSAIAELRKLIERLEHELLMDE